MTCAKVAYKLELFDCQAYTQPGCSMTEDVESEIRQQWAVYYSDAGHGVMLRLGQSDPSLPIVFERQ